MTVGCVSIDRSIGRPVRIVRYGSSGIGVCVFRVFRVCDASIEDKKKRNPSDHSDRIDRSTVSIDQSYRSINRSMTDRQTDRQTDERTNGPNPSIDSTRLDPIHRSTRLDPMHRSTTTDDDRRRPTDRVERHATDARRRRRRRRVTSSRAEEGRRRDDGGETDQQMRDGGVRVRCDRRARRRRTTDANANASGLGQIVDARAK